MIAGLISLPAFPHCRYPDELSSTVLDISPNVRQGQVSCSHALGAGLPTLALPGPALVFCPDEVQASLSHSHTVRPALLPAAGEKGWWDGGGHISLTLAIP